jgi:hypothetical protein
MGKLDRPRHASGPAVRITRMRKRYPLAMLLILIAVMMLAAALATSAFALPSFTQGSGSTPACETCHSSLGPGTAGDAIHALQTHSTLSCSTCHVVNTQTPPATGQCGGCHSGINHIVLEPTHITKGCTTCHGVSAVITSITPSHTTVGTSVTIAGTGFGAVQGTGTVTFGTTAAAVSSWNGTSIVVTVPASLSPGAVSVRVTRTDGTASAAFSFTVDGTPGPPTIASVTPVSGIVGATVTVTGTGFTGATGVTFNGVAATTFTVVSDTKITAKVPTGATTGAIAVTTSAGTATSATTFGVLIPAKITLKFSGLTAGTIKLGRTVTAKGVVTPLSVGAKVTILIQKKNSLGRFVKFTTKTGLIKALGNYSIAWRTSKRGVFRMQASIGASATHTKAKSLMSKSFRVK